MILINRAAGDDGTADARFGELAAGTLVRSFERRRNRRSRPDSVRLSSLPRTARKQNPRYRHGCNRRARFSTAAPSRFSDRLPGVRA